MENEPFDALKAYMRLADQMVANGTKEQLADAARILALNVAHYASEYGELPIEEHLDLLRVRELNDAQAQLVTHGLETLVGVLGNTLQGEEPKHECYSDDCRNA
ncbi:MAG: hypothetical protein ACREBC_05915, partial [Pyrinomonadaceae bacterium]